MEYVKNEGMYHTSKESRIREVLNEYLPKLQKPCKCSNHQEKVIEELVQKLVEKTK